MTFRTNQPGSALASQSSLHFGSRACSKIEQWILEEFHFKARLFLFLRWHLNCLPSSFFQSKDSMQSWWPPLLPLSGGDRTHLHSHSMEELLLNPHYNQSKFSPDRYMMLNRDRDRERASPLLSLRDKSYEWC